jgi:putative DNA primase/helicase
VWDGRRWRRDVMHTVEGMALRVAASIFDEAAMASDERPAGPTSKSPREVLATWAKASSQVPKLKAMLDCVAMRDDIKITTDHLDANPMLLNLSNGTYELDTDVFRPHRKEDMISCLAPTEYDPEADYSAFLNFIGPAMGVTTDGGALLGWLQKFLGYCLSGDTSEQCFGLFCGQSETGKSTLLNIVRETLGSDYAGVVRAKSLFDPSDRESEHDFNHVASCRLVTASEGQEGRRLPEDFIKSATGAEALSMRTMFKEVVEWKPKFKIVLGTNFRPTISESGNAIWRRMVFVPFQHRTNGTRDSRLAEKIVRSERAGVLRWLLNGWKAFKAEKGVFENVPKIVDDVVRDYREDEDIVREFLRTDCEVYNGKGLPEDATVEEETATPFRDLYLVFHKNCADTGDRFIISAKTFGSRLTDAGIEKGERTGKGRLKTRKGIKLSPSGEEKLREIMDKRSHRGRRE